MARYCVELVEKSRKYILHRQHCITYPRLDLLSLDRVKDIGHHHTFASALQVADQDFAAYVCLFCCPYEDSPHSSERSTDLLRPLEPGTVTA